MAGYSETVCVSCSGTVQDISQAITVSQASGCDDLVKIPDTGYTQAKKAPWHAQKTNKYPVSDTSSALYFQTTAEGCAITGCVLREKTCTTAYVGSDLSIAAGTDDWSIEYKPTARGFTASVCMVCSAPGD